MSGKSDGPYESQALPWQGILWGAAALIVVAVFASSAWRDHGPKPPPGPEPRGPVYGEVVRYGPVATADGTAYPHALVVRLDDADAVLEAMARGVVFAPGPEAARLEGAR
jgi:hypothetical protein